MAVIMRRDRVGNGGWWLKETFDVVVNSDADPSAFVQEKVSPRGHRAC